MIRTARTHLRRHWYVLVLFAVLLLLILLPRAAGGQSAGPPDQIARGGRIAQEKCSRCHAIGRTDVSPNPKAPPFRYIAGLYPLEHLAEALAEGIITGDNDMPQFKFNPRDIDAILDYMASIATRR